MEQSLFIELIHRTKGVLNSIDQLTLLSRERFEEKEFRDFFYKAIHKDVEEHNLLLDTFLKYIQSTTPIPKKDTVIRIIEEVLEKQRIRLKERKIKISEQFEEDLPETVVPDEQLKFILDSLFQYAMVMMPPDGNIRLLAKSVPLPGSSVEGEESNKWKGKYIEIVLTVGGYRAVMASSGKGQEEVLSDLVYRLVDIIVKRNGGKINFEIDEKGSEKTITLRFPGERRKVVRYQLSNE